jgi:hypothetical protein
MKNHYSKKDIDEMFDTIVDSELYEVLVSDVYVDFGVVDGREVLQINMTLIQTREPATLTEIKNENNTDI